MYYKLSNIASVEEMESMFGLTFKYPNIYSKNPLINGLDEELIPVITNKDAATQKIQFGIWGLLPEGYKEDWSIYQDNSNTLNLSVDEAKKDNELLKKRCVIIVSGFYLSYLYNGELYPFYTSPKSKKPFAIAGVYNTTYDGYITFSLLLTKIHPEVSKYHNLGKKMPLVISAEDSDSWLSEDFYMLIENSDKSYEDLDFMSHPIPRTFYKNNIFFDSFLDPTNYQSLIIPF